MKAERSFELRWNNFGLINVLIQVAIGYTIYGIDRSSFGVLVPGVIKAFHLTPALAGFVATSFLGGQAAVLILAGWLSDVWGRKRVLILGFAVFSLAVLFSGLSRSVNELVFFRLLSGVGEGIFQPAAFAVPGALFQTRRSLGQGILQATFGLGIILGPIAAAIISTHSADFGWRMPLIVFGVAGVIGTAVMAFMMDTGYSDYKPAAAAAAKGVSEPADRRWMWRFGVATVLIALWSQALWPFQGLGATYLVKVQHLTVVQAGLAGMAGGVAVLSLSLPFGLLADRFGRLNLIAIAGAIVAGAYALFFSVALTPLTAAALTFVIQGCLIAGINTNVIALIVEYVPSARLGTALGAANTLVYAFAMFTGVELGASASTIGWRMGSFYVVIIPSLAIAAISIGMAMWEKRQAAASAALASAQ
ncbi:MAG TPA: MFS transporter [Candidatus Dormibacteraeota bacterium]|nr:MFS transporter [Candidatus Dormibacteraeota bacterium]